MAFGNLCAVDQSFRLVARVLLWPESVLEGRVQASKRVNFVDVQGIRWGRRIRSQALQESEGEQSMERSQLVGRWNELKGKVKQRWGDLTDDEIAQTEGNIDELIGKIQQKYGGTKEEIRRQLEEM